MTDQARRPLYRVRDWDKHFECAQSRKISGQMKWLALPVRHDGASYRRLMRSPDGPSIYACWILILQVAAKCPQRGVLSADHGPIDAEELSIKTDCPAHLFETAIRVLSSPEIRWLEVDNQQNGSTLLASTTAVDGNDSVLPFTSTAVDVNGSTLLASTTAVDYIQTDTQTKNINQREKQSTVSGSIQMITGDRSEVPPCDAADLSDKKRLLLQALENRQSQEPKDTSLSASHLASKALGGGL